MNNPAFVLLIVIDIEIDKMYWSLFDFEKIIYEGNKWWIEIPFENEINAKTRNDWQELLGRPNDFIDSAKYESIMTNLYNSVETNTIRIPKEEVDLLSLDYIHLLLKRITKTREMAEQNRNKLEIFFNVYDNDSRELFEIKEVCDWVKFTIDSGFPWFYILTQSEPAIGMKVLFHCYSDTKKVQLIDRTWKVVIDNKKGIDFLEKNFHNLNLFCEEMKFDRSINDEISGNVNKWLESMYSNEV